MTVEGGHKRVDHLRVAADQFAAKVLPVIRELQANGVTRYRAIARELDRRGIKTARRGDWSHVQVANILKRMRTRT